MVLPTFPQTNEGSSPGKASNGNGGGVTTLAMGMPGKGDGGLVAGACSNGDGRRVATLERAMTVESPARAARAMAGNLLRW
jgi:hypothetical protein